jgi:hypothetical protein
MKPIYFCRLMIVLTACALICPLAHGQSGLSGTTLGKSQNSSEDLVNSLIPGKPHYGKGEKKEEVDPKKLPSKAIKDPTFGGSIVEMGLGSSGDPDLHRQKPRGAADQNSNAPKPADAGGEKDSKDPKVSKQADSSGDKDSQSSKSTQAGDGQNKDRKATPAAGNEKASEKEKASASKPDGDH